jgi:hypothetical protein
MPSGGRPRDHYGPLVRIFYYLRFRFRLQGFSSIAL